MVTVPILQESPWGEGVAKGPTVSLLGGTQVREDGVRGVGQLGAVA